MSKEIAQTVSGPKIAWLLAIVAAFAVLATLGTQWNKSEAAIPDHTFTLTQTPASGATAVVGDSITYTATLTTTTANSNGAVVIAIDIPTGVDITGVAPTCPANDIGGAGITWTASAAGTDPATCTSSGVLTAAITTGGVMSITGTITGDVGTATATVDDAGPEAPIAATTSGVGGVNALVVAEVPSLFHIDDDGDYILVQEVANNVRGSRHTACMGYRVTDGGVFVDVEPANVGTNFTTNFSNQPANAYNGPQPVIPQSPTALDVTRFIGSFVGTDGNADGASCFSWYSTGAGDQIVTAQFVDSETEDAVDVLFDASLPGQRGLVKEWNVLEDSVISAVIWTPATGSQTAITSTQNLSANPVVGSPLRISIPLFANVITGDYDFNGTITITDAFGGSHVNSGAQLEEFPSTARPYGLVGVTWSIDWDDSTCGDGFDNDAGVTALDSTGSATAPGFTVVNQPSITINEFDDCVLGDQIVINITGSEGDLGSGTGLTVTQQVIIDFTIPAPGAKQVFLAWAGQRIILEHDWRVPAGDVNDTSGDNYPNPVGTCFGGVAVTAGQQIDEQVGGFEVRYIKGSGPGNFLPGLGATIHGADQATVDVSTNNVQHGDANDDCISRVLFESEDQGQVDIEAFILGAGELNQVNVTKHAFVIYYMKLNTVTTSLVTQAEKPNHNGVTLADWAGVGTTTSANPWNSSLDDADNAAEWNVSKDILTRVRVTGWFLTTNPSGRPADTSNPLNVLPANRWVMPDDWAQLNGGPIDAAGLNETTHNIGTAEEFRAFYDLMIAPNNAAGLALSDPYGAVSTVVGVVATPNTGVGSAANPLRVVSCVSLTPGTGALLIGTTNLGNVVSCVNGALVVSSPLAAPATAGSLIRAASVPFEGPYSLIDIPGLASQGFGGAAVSNFDPGNIRDTIWADGDVDAWDAPMPPAELSIRVRGTGFLKPVYKSEVYYLGTANTTTQTFPNPYYIVNIPDSEYIPAIVVGGGYLWNSWGNDGPGGNGDGVYEFWDWAIVGSNARGVGETLSAADLAELAEISQFHGTVARDAVIYTDNHGEGMFAVNGDFKTDLTACATNALAGGRHCAPGDHVGTANISVTADYPDFRGKHFPVLSNAATVTWTWGGYKDVTVHPGETDQFKYIVFHAMDRDGFCSVPTGAISLHAVLTSIDAQTDFATGLGARYNGDPNENVDFLIDSGEGIIVGQSGGGTINDGRQFATGVTTFSVALNNPATSGILEFPLSPLAAEGQTDECQAWVRVSNSLLGIVNVLTIAHDDEGNIGFDRVIDLSNTMSYTLNFRWSLITWAGADGISVTDALKGTGTGGQNPGGNDISSSVTAIYGWNAAAQQWLAYFPSGVNVPGANDLTSLNTGQAYWIAITGPSSVTWTIATNIN